MNFCNALRRLRSTFQRKCFSVIALVLVFMCVYSLPVAAHGAGGLLQIDKLPLGPYTVMIWTSPSILRPGAVHVETTVLRGEHRVTNCRIKVLLTPLDQAGPLLQAEAGPANATNEFRHEAAFALDEPGRYAVSVSILDPAGRGGDASFEMEIRRVPAFVQGLIYLQIVIITLAALWILKTGSELFTK